MTSNTPNLPTQYDPFTAEAKWQKQWEESQAFKADPERGGEPYSMVIPPPNVTGSLHMGHALGQTIMDILVRYHRMKGLNTLWLPGTDHASIAVHTMLEKELQKEGKTRYQLGREKFLERAWQWKQDSEGTIVGQMRRLGLSVDWSRERFTMDEGLSKAVQESFVKMYDEGLIYRGKYLVSWCPASQSAVSDIEVEDRPTNGHLWHFRYPLTDGSGYVEVATTRPETMLGDTAVAVNPKDPRYQKLVGKTVTLPIMNREIPIVADELVDPEFGTGCVKVTPAHDPNDFEMGNRHQLPFINIMNKDGTLNENAGTFEGQDRFVAREGVVQRLETDGFLVKIEDYQHSVPYSDRGKVPIEPLLSTQWFVKIESLAKTALEFLDDRNSPQFVPHRWTKVYRDWLVKLKDWCISRQLWWGHQIPAWYAVSETGGEITDETPFVVAKNDAEAKEKAIALFGKKVKLERDADVLDTWFSSGLWPFSTMGWPETTRDLEAYYPTTTLVTGFDIIFFWVARMTMMAGHFTDRMPFKDVYIHGLVLDENGKKMSKTAGNGIDPMLMVDKYGTDALRYTLVREVAGAGQDISFRLNRAIYELNLLRNTVSVTPPSDLLEKLNPYLKELKTKVDRLKAKASQNQTLSFSELIKTLEKELKAAAKQPVAEWQKALIEKLDRLEIVFQEREPLSESVEASRNFTNKLWNASRFVMMNLDGKTPKQLGETFYGTSLQLSDRWILSRYHQVVQQTGKYIEAYGLGEAAKGLYEFIWGDFCDWYIELVKSRLQKNDVNETSPLAGGTEGGSASRQVAQQTLAYVLEGILKLLHPFMPHITEEIWQPLAQAGENETLALQSYPEADLNLISPDLERDFELLIGTIRTIRNLRSEADIKPGVKIAAILQTESEKERQILNTGQSYITDLGKVDRLTITQTLEQEPEQTIASVIGTVQVLVPLTGVVDIAALRGKLEKKLGKIEAEIKSLQARLENPNFVGKAAPEVVQGARDALAELEKQAEILRDRLRQLQG
jgi:valyl-tRNA synthetase